MTSAFHAIEWGLRMRAPAAAVYRKVEDATMGCAQYILMIIVLFILFYVGKLVWYLVSVALGLLMSGYALLTNGSGSATASGSAQGGGSTSAATPEPSYAEEEAPFQEL